MNKKTRTSATTSPKQRLLQALLEQVPFDGWTESAYAEALKQLKLDRVAADKLFPNGLRDCVELFGANADEAMQNCIAAEKNFSRMRTRDKVAFGVRARLEYFAPHREAMRRLVMWYAHPLHAPLGVKRIAKTVDLIWQAAGDTSTDYNFYTKRILLAAVMKATMLFWLSDESPKSAATWEFLDKRIGEVLKLGKSISLLKEFKPNEIVDLVRNKIRKAM